MDKKSKILFIVLGIMIAGSIALTYWRIMVKKDYIIEGQADCDPYISRCFVWECDPASNEEGEKCTGNPDEDVWHYQVVRRKAFNIPLCDPERDESCNPWDCAEGEMDCSVDFCAEDRLETQYAAYCSDPVKYSEERIH